jgi:hypothetical protein
LLLPEREGEREREREGGRGTSEALVQVVAVATTASRRDVWAGCAVGSSVTWERWGSVEFHHGERGGMWSKGIDILDVGLLRRSPLKIELILGGRHHRRPASVNKFSKMDLFFVLPP